MNALNQYPQYICALTISHSAEADYLNRQSVHFSIQRSEFDSACRWVLLLRKDLFFKMRKLNFFKIFLRSEKDDTIYWNEKEVEEDFTQLNC